MSDEDYPKWIQRAHDIGPVLVHSAVEHEHLLLSWKAHLMRIESERVSAIKAEADAAEEAELSLLSEQKDARTTRRGK